MSLDTLRVLAVVRGRKSTTWVYGILQVLLFLFLISWELGDMSNTLNVVAFCAGFATGNTMGIIVEEKIAFGYKDLRVVSSGRGREIAARLRENGFGVTEIAGHGLDGTVDVLKCSVPRKELADIASIVRQVDTSAFVSAEDIRLVSGGFWGK